MLSSLVTQTMSSTVEAASRSGPAWLQRAASQRSGKRCFVAVSGHYEKQLIDCFPEWFGMALWSCTRLWDGLSTSWGGTPGGVLPGATPSPRIAPTMQSCAGLLRAPIGDCFQICMYRILL